MLFPQDEISGGGGGGEEEDYFIKALRKEPERRTNDDVQRIFYTLRSFTCLDRLEDGYLLSLSSSCYYLRKQANDILYCRGEIAHSWFILVTGSVFIEGSMFLPITCFGRRPSSSMTRRPNECLILEPSEMICIDYVNNNASSNNENMNMMMTTMMMRNTNRGSIHSDTSSAYSGSLSSSSCYLTNSNEETIDLSGLLESLVDDDDGDDDDDGSENGDGSSCASTDDSASLQEVESGGGGGSIRDTVRECLEKDPSERTEKDVQILLEFTQHLAAFNDLTLNVRKALCTAMIFAVVDKANTVVLSHGEELDSWSVLVNGTVEIIKPTNNGETVLLSSGDSFGLPPTLSKQYFEGQMRTRCDDCQFVFVTQLDYFRILKQGQENQKIVKDADGKPILVFEARSYRQQQSPAFIIIRGTKEALISELFKQESTDPTFVEDFLLTQRIFMNLHELAETIINNFNDVAIRDKVTRVMLLWVNNHFIDFEVDLTLMGMLQRFQSMLESNKDTMAGQLRLLQIACSAKSRPRTVVLSRASREDTLPFNIMGGADNGYGIFLSHVDVGGGKPGCVVQGIRIGDEVLSVNNVNFRSISLAKAFEILKGATHLVIVLKCNFLGYYECINSSSPLIPSSQQQQQQQKKVATTTPTTQKSSSLPKTASSSSHLLSKHGRFRKALQRVHLIPKKRIESATSALFNSDKETAEALEEERPKIDFPENVLKIYRGGDQTYKFFLVNKETTAREVVMLALNEFQETHTAGCSRDYALFQVQVNSVANGSLMLKQTRLPDTLESLAERIPLGSRYYIKRMDSSDPLVPNELLPELYKESQVTLLNLNPTELALQLTLEDYACFRQIEMTEFIDDLFHQKAQKRSGSSSYGTPNLSQFAELVNRETFWVVTELVHEQNLHKRILLIKRFVKVALQCRECRNYNSMFAIISGLGHSAVTRLKATWDKLPNKYLRSFKELQDLMDPSRNMYKYRSLLQASSCSTPMIPFYPVVKKDLTFIDLGNSTHLDHLVNFEKMRMVAKEIRSLVQMSAAPFDTSSQPTMAAMNQLGHANRTLTTTTGKMNKNKNKLHHHHHLSSSSNSSKSSQPHPKKMYEEMNMVRKVKAYLHRLVIISDEKELDELSFDCEGGKANNSSGGGTLKRPTSPTPSTTSSTTTTNNSNNNAAGDLTMTTTKNKFGTGSPHSYQKLLSLSSSSSFDGGGGNKHTLSTKVTTTTTTKQRPSPNSSFISRPPSSQTGPPTAATTTTRRILLSTESSSVNPTAENK